MIDIKYKKIYRAFIVAICICLILSLVGCSAWDNVIDVIEDHTSSGTAQNDFEQFYYDQLTSSEKKAYMAMKKGCENRKDKIVLKPLDTASFYKAQGALMYDYPEYFWIRSFSISLLGEKVISVTYPYEDGYDSQLQEVEETAKQVARQTEGLSQYDTAKYFYDYIIDLVEYDASGNDTQDLRSVFLSKRSVCAGYAKAFQYLCRLSGIPCITVRGTTREGESHAWNMIQINGNNYWVDVTWGDPVYAQETELDNTNYNYFCVPDEELLKTHTISHNIEMDQMTIENAFQFPSCSDDSLNYYRLNGSYFDSYDRNTIRNYLTDKMKSGKMTGLEMKFGSDEAYQSAMADLFTGNKYIEAILLDYRSFGIHSISYTYGFMDDCNYIVLSIHYQ